MKTRTLALVGAVLALPTFLFVSANLLNEVGAPFLYNALDGMIKVIDSPIVILGGLFGAVALNLWPILRVSVRREPEAVVGTVRLRPQALNLAVLATSAVHLAVIMVYLVGETMGHLRAAGL